MTISQLLTPFYGCAIHREFEAIFYRGISFLLQVMYWPYGMPLQEKDGRFVSTIMKPLTNGQTRSGGILSISVMGQQGFRFF
jgi:hypothetical protein